MENEIISTFWLYVILQLDAIKETAVGFTILFGLISIGCLTDIIINSCDVDNWKMLTIHKVTTICAIGIFMLSAATLAFAPTSRNAALIAILPAVANNATIQAEASELYDLAKEGMRNLVTPEKRTRGFNNENQKDH